MCVLKRERKREGRKVNFHTSTKEGQRGGVVIKDCFVLSIKRSFYNQRRNVIRWNYAINANERIILLQLKIVSDSFLKLEPTS